MPSEERIRAEWIRVQVETELHRIGGDELLDDARSAAELHAALFYPWDDRGDEPVERLYARLDVLADRLDRAPGSRGELA